MNKESLILEIEKIPKFVLRDVATKQEYNEVKIEVSDTQQDVTTVDKYDWVEQENFKAVTEENGLYPLAFVTKRYNLIQFKEVFNPLIANIEELEGELNYYGGVAFMDIFPIDEKLRVNGGNDKIGIVALNSVNCSCSVIVKFCVEHDKKVITIPKKIAGFKRVHTGKALEMTQNFLSVVDRVKNIWKTILEEFTKIKVDENYANIVLDEVGFKEQNLRKKLIKKVMSSSDMNLWDMFLEIINIAEERRYKSNVHKRKKMDLIAERMFRYAVISKLINA